MPKRSACIQHYVVASPSRLPPRSTGAWVDAMWCELQCKDEHARLMWLPQVAAMSEYAMRNMTVLSAQAVAYMHDAITAIAYFRKFGQGSMHYSLVNGRIGIARLDAPA